MAFVFPRLPTPKRWLGKCLKSLVSEDPSTSNMVNVPKYCPNLHHMTFILFYITVKSFELEKVSLIGCQILGLVVNTLGVAEKYLVFNRDNLTMQVQMQLSQKQKSFSQFYLAFLNSSLNFKHFES